MAQAHGKIPAMRLMRRALVVAVLVLATAPAQAGKRRPPLIVAVEKGDGAKVAKLLKRAKPRDLDAFDDAPGSPTAGLRAIEVAARRGDAALVDALLAAGAAATARALEAAAEGGQLAMTTRLLERGAPRADLALTAAAKAGHADIVAALLPAARAADRYFNLDQVLEFAVYFPPRPSAAVVALLLREHANPALAWGPGAQTVLHMAVRKGADDVVATLLAAGAPVDAEDKDGVTPLLAAINGARLDIARALLAAKADPRRRTRRGDTAMTLIARSADASFVPLLELLRAAQVPIDHATPEGVTALMVAAGAGNRAWIDVLLARGAAPAARTTDGAVALDFALACPVDQSPWGPGAVRDCHGAVALALLAGPRPPLGRPDGRGRTTLARAIMSGDDALVARLLALGVRDAGPDDRGANPYHYAARYGSPAMIAALAGATLGGAAALAAVDDADQTPLAIARSAGKPGVVDALVAAGAK